MAYTTIVAGTTITASWANASVRDQVISPFADSSARSSAITAPVEGMMSYLTGTDRFEGYQGSAWERCAWLTSTGRTGGIWSRSATQSINNITVTDISWDTESADSDSFLAITGATLTIPSGLGGIYIVCSRGAYSSSTTGVNFCRITMGGTTFEQPGTESVTGFTTITAMAARAAANTIKVSLYHTNGGAITWTGNLWVFRMGA
jgi:hypothetical protein